MISNEMHTDTVIIGAGLTGLTLAHKLRQKGKNVLLIEKSDRCGGVIRTHQKEGFIYESGPNTGVLGTPEMAELLEELQEYCTLAVADEKSKKRLILKNGKWHALPSGLFSAVSTPLFTLKDKFRVLAEPFRQKGDNPHESLADMVRRRLGKSFLQYAIDPFIGGIYAGDTEKIIPKYALPKLYALEQDYGSFIKGAFKKQKETKSQREKKATKQVFSVKGGFQNLIDALVQSVGKENIILNAKNTSVNASGEKFQLSFKNTEGENSAVTANKLVSTAGAYQLPEIFPFFSEEELAPITELRYAAVTQAVVGFKKWTAKMPDSFGGLIPSTEKSKLLGILYPSAIFNDRAPKNAALLSVFMGGIRKPEVQKMTDNEIRQTVFDAIKKTLSVKEPKPELFEIFRYKHAIPQYEITSKERFERIKKIETEYPGLFLAGNIRDGIGMADRVKQAFRLAEQL